MTKEIRLYDDLINACIRKEARAQKELYDLFAPAMFKVCMRYAQDESAAQDIFQDAFVKIYQNLNRIESSAHLPGWVKKIVVYTSIDYLRSSAKYAQHQKIETAYDLASKEPTVFEQLGEATILSLVQKLPPRSRMVFNLYVMEGYSHKEIGALLQISEGTSKSQLFEAKKALQKAIEKNERTQMIG
ncbi:MAG: RNA polymerase sigma factor [Flavobacteriales bacterium]